MWRCSRSFSDGYSASLINFSTSCSIPLLCHTDSSRSDALWLPFINHSPTTPSLKALQRRMDRCIGPGQIRMLNRSVS